MNSSHSDLRAPIFVLRFEAILISNIRNSSILEFKKIQTILASATPPPSLKVFCCTTGISGYIKFNNKIFTSTAKISMLSNIVHEVVNDLFVSFTISLEKVVKFQIIIKVD